MQIHSVGIDLGKTTFHLVALGAAGKVLVRRKFTQRQLLTYTANMQASLIGLEADLTPQMRNLINLLGDEWKTVEQQIEVLSLELERGNWHWRGNHGVLTRSPISFPHANTQFPDSRARATYAFCGKATVTTSRPRDFDS